MLRSEEPIEKLREPPTMWPYRFVLPLVVDTQAPKGNVESYIFKMLALD